MNRYDDCFEINGFPSPCGDVMFLKVTGKRQIYFVFPSPCGDVMFRLSIVKISWVRCFRPLAGM